MILAAPIAAIALAVLGASPAAWAGCAAAPAVVQGNAPAASPASAAPPQVPWEKQVGGVSWLTSYPVALEKALVNRRPLLVLFQADWCGWCRKLERTTFPDPRVAELMRFVVPVRLDGDREKALAAMLRAGSFPMTVLLGRDGREIGRIAGYRPPEEFARLLSAFLSAREPLGAARAEASARPADAEALYTLADMLIAVGDYEEARTVLARVAALSDMRAGELAGDVALDGALTHLFAHQYAAALAGLEDYLARFPEGDRRDEALFFYGAALLAAGRREESLAALGEAGRVTATEYIRLESDRLARMARGERASGQR